MFCAATTSKCKNFFSSSPAILWHAHFTTRRNPLTNARRSSLFIFFVFSLSSLSAACFFFFFFRRHRSSFFNATNFPLFLSKMNNAKEFTNEERSLLKFQKKQQHGQVLLLLLLVVVVVLVHSYSYGSVVLFLFVVYCVWLDDDDDFGENYGALTSFSFFLFLSSDRSET